MLQKDTSSISDKIITQISKGDYAQVANFLNQNNYIHRHLDWFTPLDWVGKQPFLAEIVEDRMQAILCTVPENSKAAWVRTFGIQKTINREPTWERLLVKAQQQLKFIGVARLAALALHPWFESLLKTACFQNIQNIVVLEWQGNLPDKDRSLSSLEIRPMRQEDLTRVSTIDQLAFPPLWQNSIEGLTKAFHQPGISTVAIINSKIIGYQISTSMTIYGHIARLAVHPKFQRQGVAFNLIFDLLQKFNKRGFWRVTVNTQSNNHPSITLYKKFSFDFTQEEIPVYELDLK